MLGLVAPPDVPGRPGVAAAYLRHFPFLSFLHGAAAGADHSQPQYIGVFVSRAFGRTVGRTVGPTRGVARTIGAARGTTTTVAASAGRAMKSTKAASRLML